MDHKIGIACEFESDDLEKVPGPVGPDLRVSTPFGKGRTDDLSWTAVSPVPHNPPASLTSFVGRRVELIDVGELLGVLISKCCAGQSDVLARPWFAFLDGPIVSGTQVGEFTGFPVDLKLTCPLDTVACAAKAPDVSLL